VVSAVEGQPIAVVHVPGPTIFPFVLSVGFLLLFTAALLDSAGLALLGGLVSLAGVVGWFWPRRSERLALQEMAARGDGHPPLAVAGPLSNGWWATVVLLLVLATALATLVASYVYLGDGTLAWAPVRLDVTRPLLASGLLGAGGLAIVGAAATLRRRAVWTRRLALAMGTALGVAFIVASVATYRAAGLAPHESAYASIVLGFLGFQWLLVALGLAMVVAAQCWAWLAPHDPRGHGVLLNAALVNGFGLVAWAVVFATVYLTPRLG
jgi:heme/copper-type cytochrome/quinol oxidase subunit 3